MKNQLNIYINEVCRQGLDQGVFSGISAGVSVYKDRLYKRGLFSGGWTRFDEAAHPIQRDTLFDLASLTKPLCTTLCVLYLIATGKIRCNDSLLSFFDIKNPGEKRKIEIQHLLNHSSGLPSYKPYFEKFKSEYLIENQEYIVQKILQEPLEYSPGKTCRYSDLGFILLGALVEKIAGMDLENAYRTFIIDPLGLSPSPCFLSLARQTPVQKELIAATEYCGWRKKQIQGEVHDEHSWLMGGVAGHAGLFGSIEGVLTLCEYILNMWKKRAEHAVFPNALLQWALETKHPIESWCFGFDTPSQGRSSSGSYFSPRSVGHLGFSGTSFWIDPEKDIVIVLLTNRIYPTRMNTKIKEFRPFFHDYLMDKTVSLIKRGK